MNLVPHPVENKRNTQTQMRIYNWSFLYFFNFKGLMFGIQHHPTAWWVNFMFILITSSPRRYCDTLRLILPSNLSLIRFLKNIVCVFKSWNINIHMATDPSLPDQVRTIQKKLTIWLEDWHEGCLLGIRGRVPFRGTWL